MEKIVFAKDITLYKADCLEVMPFLPESALIWFYAIPLLELQLHSGIK